MHCTPPAAGVEVKGPGMMAPASLCCWWMRLEMLARRVRAGIESSWLTQSECQTGADPAEMGCAAGSRHPLGCMEPASLGRDPP